MTQGMPFSEVLDAADHLSHDEQRELIGILHRRLAEVARKQLATDVAEARKEFLEGHCPASTPADLMREILK